MTALPLASTPYFRERESDLTPERAAEIERDRMYLSIASGALTGMAKRIHEIADRGRENGNEDLFMEAGRLADDLDFEVEKAIPRLLRELEQEGANER